MNLEDDIEKTNRTRLITPKLSLVLTTLLSFFLTTGCGAIDPGVTPKIKKSSPAITTKTSTVSNRNGELSEMVKKYVPTTMKTLRKIIKAPKLQKWDMWLNDFSLMGQDTIVEKLESPTKTIERRYLFFNPKVRQKISHYGAMLNLAKLDGIKNYETDIVCFGFRYHGMEIKDVTIEVQGVNNRRYKEINTNKLHHIEAGKEFSRNESYVEKRLLKWIDNNMDNYGKTIKIIASINRTKLLAQYRDTIKGTRKMLEYTDKKSRKEDLKKINAIRKFNGNEPVKAYSGELPYKEDIYVVPKGLLGQLGKGYCNARIKWRVRLTGTNHPATEDQLYRAIPYIGSTTNIEAINKFRKGYRPSLKP
ncbi:MAG: hypothetical protein U9R08_01290 [Nanoarchaeota archaeon]|nr:hypothetical protein [Nanoarchaeota archaeon]